ncbi:MAG: hypothetical protein WDO14_09115 [Bacteroidota bacterium]
MKLYVHDKNTKVKSYLDIVAPTRGELARTIGSGWFSLLGNQYHVHEVIAESSENNLTAGAIVGGIIGLIGGPLGVIIGGSLGGALGNESDKGEANKVHRFNSSSI